MAAEKAIKNLVLHERRKIHKTALVTAQASWQPNIKISEAESIK